VSRAIRPYVYVSAAEIAKIRNSSTKFDSGVGFSNGCALFALKKPPPFAARISAKIRLSGSSTCTVARSRSTQKLPSVAGAPGSRRRVRPRASASATAMPAAADMKFCHARPAIWVR
jgi:hypothetical protein